MTSSKSVYDEDFWPRLAKISWKDLPLKELICKEKRHKIRTFFLGVKLDKFNQVNMDDKLGDNRKKYAQKTP